MNFTLESNIHVNENVVSRSNSDGTVIVMKMTDDDFFFKIKGVAADMWIKFSQKNENLGSVINQLVADYDTSSEAILSDSQEFLNKCLELNLIKVV